VARFDLAQGNPSKTHKQQEEDKDERISQKGQNLTKEKGEKTYPTSKK
jgi:hypothetical protein